MGKKQKVGKARKDKFYQLAKETGYRSRASFKLLQLNRKFEFLQKSRVVIDLCAAPGGWLQVVSENTPISSIILGVDLVSIKPIKNVKTFQEDITTEKCRQTLRKELHNWKADVVLNDGAPNLGKSWIHDAFQQVSLTLHAVKLASEMLRKGGWFISKLFRSKDYNSLMWVLQQLFQHVHATKPQASRTESAEIFVVCQGFLAPSKIDPKFFDHKYVFKDIEEEKRSGYDLAHPEKKKRNREGYEEGDTLYHKLSVTEFFYAENHLETLADASEVVLDDEKITNHPLTTVELKECLKDIKVLGRKEIKNILTWRKKLLTEFEEENKPAEEVVEKEEENEEEVAQAMIAACKDEERRKIKKKLKKIREQKTKLRQRMDSKMVLPSDQMNLATDDNYFKLDRVKSKDQLRDIDLDAEDLDSEQEDGEYQEDKRKRFEVYDKEDKSYLDSESDELEFEEEPDLVQDSDRENEVEDEEEEENPLVVDIDPKDVVLSNKTNSWFSKESFADIGDDDEEDEELEKMVADYKKKGGTVIENGVKKSTKRKTEDSTDITSKKKKVQFENDVDSDDSGVEESDSSDGDDSDSDSDSDYGDMEANQLVSNTAVPGDAKTSTSPQKKKNKKSKKGDFEVVPAEDLKLDAVGLAIGAKMVSSRKQKRDIIDGSYHRYMFDDENLPDWFMEDEAKHTERQLPVTKAEIEEYKLKMKAIDAQPIKKVAEAKARKKRKAAKKLEKVRRKAEVITENVDVSDKEKWQQIKALYKKAGLLKKDKKEVTYVVGHKGGGKRVSRPAGVKGPYKVVDARMKKDKRKQKNMNKKNGKKNNKMRKK